MTTTLCPSCAPLPLVDGLRAFPGLCPRCGSELAVDALLAALAALFAAPPAGERYPSVEAVTRAAAAAVEVA